MENATAPLDTAPASSTESTPAGSAPPDTASPERPTEGDIELLSAGQRLELTLRDLYDAALETLADDELEPVFRTMRENHEEYANALSGLLGIVAPQQRDDTLYDELLDGFETGDRASIAAAAYDAESQAVATHVAGVGRLEGIDGAETVASFLIVESEHCTVLADIAGNGDDLDALLDNSASPQTVTAASTAASIAGTTEA